MTIPGALALLVACAALPYLVGGAIRSTASPSQLILYAALSILAITTSSAVLLGTVAGAGTWEIHSVSDALGRCIGVATRSLADPLSHFPRTLAIGVTAVFVSRLLIGVTGVARQSLRMIRLTREAVTLDSVGFGLPSNSEIVVVVSERPFATAWGIFRRRAVLSTSLLSGLSPEECRAIYEHELAHVRHHHAIFIALARTLEGAFWFVPALGRLSRDLLLGLEAAADRVAADVVGDPLIVAGALARAAEQQEIALGLGGGDVAERIRRLTGRRDEDPGGAQRLIVGLTFALFVTGLVSLPTAAHGVLDGARTEVAHGICELRPPRADLLT